MGFAHQLELIGLWHYAIFVILCLPQPTPEYYSIIERAIKYFFLLL